MKDMMDMPTEVMDHKQVVQVQIYTYCYQICWVLLYGRYRNVCVQLRLSVPMG